MKSNEKVVFKWEKNRAAMQITSRSTVGEINPHMTLCPESTLGHKNGRWHNAQGFFPHFQDCKDEI